MTLEYKKQVPETEKKIKLGSGIGNFFSIRRKMVNIT